MKSILTFCFSACILIALRAQAPVNDDCSGLIDLGVLPYCSDPAQYTNVNATQSIVDGANNTPVCFNNNAERDVWFQFTPPADGSIIDVTISVWGNIGGNGTLVMPEVAVYRGLCIQRSFAELDCAAAALNVNEVHLNLFGLTPGIPYFLRINDYSASATPNAGTFKLCVEKYVPEINMGDEATTGACSGTLWDSGGPSNDYSNQSLEFSICPTDFHQCILLNVENYALETGFTSDFLQFYLGDNSSTGTLLTQITGAGSNFSVQIPGNCATVRLFSNGSVTDEGFKITWTCSPDVCTAPPITTCSDPSVISALPYTEQDLNNCFSGNTITSGPCDDALFMQGNDYIFSYTSAGDECIQIVTSGTNTGAGIGVYDQCPNAPGANCIALGGGGFASLDPFVNAAFLENPGTYYIVFGAGVNCSPFNISIDTVTCPVILPPAATCDNSLNIGGCSTALPEIIALNPGAGDPNFLVDGVNQGCFVNPQFNYAFFYFTAGADGKFGFLVESADPNEASDIDFNVWGPIPDPNDICDYVSNNQPIRSSWTGGQLVTGLADINPATFIPVTDDFDCDDPSTPGAGGDRIVRRIDVLAGETYVILLDDYSNAIVQGGISIDFNGTTPGVLINQDSLITVSPMDTAVCLGQSLNLHASGGEAYFWTPENTLSCSVCPSPLATPTEKTSYQVQVVTACKTVTRTIDVDIVHVDLGPDATVCNDATFVLNPNPPSNGTWAWTGGPGLSCYDCTSPTVAGLTTGIYTYIAFLTTPECTVSDTIKINVVNGQQPQYTIANDAITCSGETVSLGGPEFNGSFYSWASQPVGFTSDQSNPAVSPTETTTYYLTTQNGTCPVSALDSVVVNVFQPPVINIQGDTALCNGQSALLGFTMPQTGVTYNWTPDNGTLSNANTANPTATPSQSTLYTLTAFNDGCVVSQSVQLSVVNLNFSLSTADTLRICQGTSVPVQATVTPPNTLVSWTPFDGLQISANGATVVATPIETTFYTATVSLPGCIRTESLYIAVDSLPDALGILPADTSLCKGEKAILRSVLFEPSEYPEITFEWTPMNGQLTPDSLYNIVVQPFTTTVYTRITTNGVCKDTATATVTIIEPAEMKVTPSDTTICFGQSVLLLLTYSPGVTEIKWSPSSGLSCDDCDEPLATPTGTTQYSVEGKFEGCLVTTGATVNVINPPAIQFPSDVNLCKGESITLNEVSTPGSVYTWTSTDPNFGTVTNPQPTITPTQTATYFVQANNQCSSMGQITVTVNSATMEAKGDTTICQGASANLTASSSLPGTFQWSDGQSGQAINVTPSQTTVYTVTYTYGDNCQLTDQVTVNVQGQSADVVFPNDLGLCPGESIQLNSAITPGATYAWTSSPAGFTSALPTPTVTPSQTTTYTVTATLGTCVKTSSVTVVAYSATLTVPPTQKICLGESVDLTANASTTGNFEWTPGGTGSSINFNPTASGNFTFDVSFTYGDNCELQDQVMVMVAPNFDLSIKAVPSKDTLSIGDMIDLSAVLSPPGNLNTYSFVWKENSVQIGTNPLITVQPTTNDTIATFIYSLTATSANGCVQDTAIRIVVLQPEVGFPNVFSPNGDNLNDTFKMIVKKGNAIINHMEIYDRWGNKVFDSTDPNAAWDGNIDGQPALTDVYVFVILWERGDGVLISAKGDVTLLR